MKKNNKIEIYLLTSLIILGLFSVAGAIIWYGSKSTFYTSNLLKSTPNETQLRSERHVDYRKLRQYLQQRDWKAADRETYLRMLDAAGPKAQANGMTPQDEMDNLPCTDLRTIDELWNEASNGQQGFTVQMNLLRALGNYRQMYAKIRWQELPPSNKWLFEWTYNTQTKRMEFLKGKEPNYLNPPPGHLPTVERGYNFGVALNGALTRCNF